MDLSGVVDAKKATPRVAELGRCWAEVPDILGSPSRALPLPVCPARSSGADLHELSLGVPCLLTSQRADWWVTPGGGGRREGREEGSVPGGYSLSVHGLPTKASVWSLLPAPGAPCPTHPSRLRAGHGFPILIQTASPSAADFP